MPLRYGSTSLHRHTQLEGPIFLDALLCGVHELAWYARVRHGYSDPLLFWLDRASDLSAVAPRSKPLIIGPNHDVRSFDQCRHLLPMLQTELVGALSCDKSNYGVVPLPETYRGSRIFLDHLHDSTNSALGYRSPRDFEEDMKIES